MWRTVRERLGRIAASFRGRPTLEQLERIRRHELDLLLRLLPRTGRVLEIGAGTGWQARRLADEGYQVDAIDLPSGFYVPHRVWPVIDYDGHTIPFADGTFDVVFSSNVLEHVPHVREFQAEIHRVLKAHGMAVHVLPSGVWRFWTNLAHLVKCRSLPVRHGEHASNAFTEMLFFRRRWWAALFAQTGWTIVAQRSNRLFYTGHSLLDRFLAIRARGALARVLGGSCNVFVLRKTRNAGGALCPHRTSL